MLTFTAPVSAFFLPDDAAIALPAMLSAINGAQHTIRCIDYGFTDPDLLGALAAAYQRGVDVRIILDLTQSKGHGEVGPLHHLMLTIPPQNFRIGQSTQHHIIHSKVCAVDSQTVIEGSLNWTATGFEEMNTLDICQSPEYAAAIEASFDRHWSWLSANEPQYQPKSA